MRTFEENIGEISMLPRPAGLPPRPHNGLLGFPARLVEGLPAHVRLDVVDRGGRGVVIATGPDEAERLRAAGEIVIDGQEWTALAVAAESDRVFAADLEVLLATRGPGRITAEIALAGARADPPRGWSVGTVLDRLGLRLLDRAAVASPANERTGVESARLAA